MPSKGLVEHKYYRQVKRKSGQIWFGTIKKTIDRTRNGRMLVYIPEITGLDDSDDALFDCAWSSPFAGATQLGAQTDANDPSAAQTSYGMWMRPPDPGTMVVVGIVEINARKEAVILSCLFHENRNFMVPGIPAGSTGDPATGTPGPVTEPNMNADPKNFDPTYTYKGGGKVRVQSESRPEHPLASSIFYQGLADDFTRGYSTSGARREDISECFGILTPGSRQDSNPRQRNPGHQFVMDDNENSNLIRLRTGQGMQILMSDTNDLIYIINKRGTGYIEIDSEGNIDIFGKGSFNVRTTGDMNLRADQNVNIEAGQNVNIKAANNAPHPYDEGRGLGGIVDDPIMALENPMVKSDFEKVLKNGKVNIEGFSSVNLKGQNLKFEAFPLLPTSISNGLEGKITIMGADSFRVQAKDIIGDATGRVTQNSSVPGNILFTSTGVLDARAPTSTLQGTTKLNLEGAAVDIATAMSPAIEKPAITPSSGIKQTGKPMTLSGFAIFPLPIPLPEQPERQVQGKGNTQLGKPTQPGAPVIEMHAGQIKTILSRIPQPEPSKSKKDTPLEGGFTSA